MEMKLSPDLNYLSGDQIRFARGAEHKTNGTFAKGEPSLIVIHYTAGAFDSAIGWLTGEAQASCHFVVARNGRIAQLMPLYRTAWHAGKSVWKGKPYVNRISFSVELEGFGPLERTGSGLYRTKSLQPWSLTIPSGETELVRDGSYWHNYPEAQVERTIRLCQLLAGSFPSIKEIVGHSDVAPGRKLDPGPAFPMDRLRKEVFGNV